MKKEKLYFENIDATMCMQLNIHIADAKLEGLKSITLVEAIPDDETTDYIWCTSHGEVVGRDDCRKSICSLYSSKSGRGVCSNRGKLYLHGEKVTFNIEHPKGKYDGVLSKIDKLNIAKLNQKSQ